MLYLNLKKIKCPHMSLQMCWSICVVVSSLAGKNDCNRYKWMKNRFQIFISLQIKFQMKPSVSVLLE